MSRPTPSGASAQRVRALVAECLRVDAQSLDARTPLTAYGIDSLGSLELLAAIEDAFDCRLPEWLLTECPDLERLTSVLEQIARTGDGHQGHAPLPPPLYGFVEPENAGRTSSLMRADSRLPDDIWPAPGLPAPGVQRVLLTGATGFLGASLVRALIDAGVHVVCLVRAGEAPAFDRMRFTLERYGLWKPDDAPQLTAETGDLEQPRLGLTAERYNQLAHGVGAIYHAGADVNWVSAYEALRTANVLGTSELLRLACTGVLKRFLFVSSLSVCYAHGSAAAVREDTDMLPLVERLPLGYAQSKCVAESLVRAAAARGVPAQIYRPALIAGHSASGASNPDDLIAALFRGCVQMGAAPDLDWVFDAIPVDTAASTIVRLSRSITPGLETFHLCHPRPRHWRECVLWANVFGYRIQLEPYACWVERLAREACTPEHALHRLRSFFMRQIGGSTVPQHYEQDARRRVECVKTRSREDAAAITYPPLDAGLLDAYFQDYVARGFLPPPPRGRSRRQTNAAEWASAGHFESQLRRHFGDERLRVTGVTLVRKGSDRSVISELTSWRQARPVGLFQYRLDLEVANATRSLDLVVKVKPPDEDVLEVAETIATICDARVSREIRRFRDRIGIRSSHVREIEICAGQTDPRLLQHMPVCYGSWGHDDQRSWGLLLERLDGMAVMDASDDVSAWTDEHVATAVDGLAAIHSVWLNRTGELEAKPWMGHVPTTASAAAMAPLWRALADHAAPMFSKWAGATVVRTHAQLVESVASWWPALEALPRTLIHNDFNSRNIGIRRTPGGPCLVAYDWELATVGAPQRDLAELLCFVLPEPADAGWVGRWVERHRVQLERASGCELPAALWHQGFRSALADVLTSRLAFYALIDRVCPQPFLPRVVAAWDRLHALTAERATR